MEKSCKCGASKIPEYANYCPECGLLLPVDETNNHYALIDYRACCEKLFNYYFKDDSYNLDEILCLASKLYRDKSTLDFLVGNKQDYSFDNDSVWGITEMIINRYSYLQALQDQTQNSLSRKIGDYIRFNRNKD